MRRSWLYLASRSDWATEPILICPAAVATARSAIEESSVSPERPETTALKSGVLRHLDHIERLAERTDLIHLHQHGICRMVFDCAPQSHRVCGEQVVANQLDTISQSGGQHLPTSPIVLCQRVLDGNQWIFADPSGQEFYQAIAIVRPAFGSRR